MKKKGNILTENVIFIILTLVFLVILMLFLTSKSKDVSVLEEKYAKQIALILDLAKPGMEIHVNLNDALNLAKRELGENSIDNIVSLDNNLVTVKLSKDSGYSYSFFNNINIEKPYLDKEKGEWIFFIT